jgi:predicted RNA methylase
VDLGAGDGIIIFEAAQQAFLQKLNTQFYAIEINPILLGILWIRKLLHPNHHNIHILKRNMFTVDYTFLPPHASVTFYVYISPWLIDTTMHNIQKQLKNVTVVSYFYQVKSLPTHTEEVSQGVHTIYRYS